MKRPYILHPLLFAAFPVLSLYATNLTEVRLDMLLRPLVVSLVAAALLVLLFRLIGRKWRRAALAASLVVVLFYSFGHVYLLVWTYFPATIFSRANLLLAVWMSGLILGVWALLRISKKTVKPTIVLNTISSALVISMALFLAWDLLAQRVEVTWKHPATLDPRPGPDWDGTKPDIYYIILDGYGSEAVLREFYGVDNSAFLDDLRSRGFVVANDSAANYWKTRFSLSSSLNFHYLPDLADLLRDETRDPVVPQLINDSAVRRFLEAQGYQTVTFATNYFFSDVQAADVYFRSKSPVTQFEMNLLAGTMAIFWVDWATPVYQRQDIVQHFDNLQQVASIQGPKFVFAHFVVPHPPFVFTADGRPAKPAGNFDGNVYSGGIPHYLNGYAEQVTYATRMAEQVIDAIFASSDTPPVIILQGDHGPGAYLVWNSVESSCLRERFPILNAYYLPGKEEIAASIPQDITPVNSFRVVFNAYFDTRLPLEPNRHYAAPLPYMYNFEEVTDRLDWCPVDTAIRQE